ncbi:hypothetical protein BH11BAC3_BH11BAC3_08660 [soil metagenome]
MKYYTSILTFFFSSIVSISFGQRSAYYDALYLKSQLESIKTIKLEPANKELFDYYFGKTSSSDEMEDSILKNPFLKEFYHSETAQGLFSGAIQKGLSSAGSLNVTNIADGVAQFLIKRGKEELNVAFFTRMKKFLDDPNNPECKTLFPVTIEFLSTIETYRYAELIQSLREAFHKDLSNLVISLNQLIDLPRYKEIFKDLPEVRAAVRTSKIVSELSQGEGGIWPDSIIHSLALMPDLQDINSNLGNALKLVDIFSQSVREVNTVDGNRWIKLSDFNALVNDKVTLKIFIGLIYQRAKLGNIQFGKIRVDQFMESNVTTLFVLSGWVENFAMLANDVDRTIKDFKEKLSIGKPTADDYYTYISKAINITEYGFKIANIIKENSTDDPYITIARNANELYKNIYTKNYNNAVMNAYLILKKVFNKSGDNPNVNPALQELLKKLGPAAETIEKILKYGNFMASVVKSATAEEVQQALEAAALPAGSYSIKQKSAFNIAANGYIGYGFDFNGGLYARGIYAPVGISFSEGSQRDFCPVFSAFVSLIDVGSIATYRLQNGATEALKQEVRLESIFSPSAQLLVEPIRGFPLAVAAGWRRTPKLFYSDNTSFTAVPSTDVFNLSILIDIPLFNIVNKSFTKK